MIISFYSWGSSVSGIIILKLWISFSPKTSLPGLLNLLTRLHTCYKPGRVKFPSIAVHPTLTSWRKHCPPLIVKVQLREQQLCSSKAWEGMVMLFTTSCFMCWARPGLPVPQPDRCNEVALLQQMSKGEHCGFSVRMATAWQTLGIE